MGTLRKLDSKRTLCLLVDRESIWRLRSYRYATPGTEQDHILNEYLFMRKHWLYKPKDVWIDSFQYFVTKEVK